MLPWTAYAQLISVKAGRELVVGIPSCRLRLSCRCHDNQVGHPFYLGAKPETGKLCPYRVWFWLEMMDILKRNGFARLQSGEKLSDPALWKAAQEMEAV